ncbi:hypothetical protein ACI78V_02325 [Geodermatophilus sp. SYSU D00742]
MVESTTSREVRGRQLLTLTDQALSSATNFAVSIAAARALTPRALGAFAVAMATYLIMLGIVRAACGETLLVRHAGSPAERWPSLTSASTGLAAAGGGLAAVLSVGAGLLVGGGTGTALVALGVLLPGLLVQDAWRYCFLGQGRPGAATVLDAAWLVLLVPALAALALTGWLTAASLVLAWGAAGVLALAAGLVLDTARPSLPAGRAFLRAHGQLIRRYSLEFLTGYGSYQLLVYALAAQFGLALTGLLRLALTALSPVNVLFQGAYTVATLRGIELRPRGRAALLRWSATVAAALTAIALAWTAALLLAPDDLMRALLGEAWPAARELVPWLGVWLVTVAVQSGAATGLHSIADSARSLRAQLCSAPAVLAFAWGGAVLAAAPGVAVGYALAGATALAIWWQAYLRGLRTPSSPA